MQPTEDVKIFNLYNIQNMMAALVEKYDKDQDGMLNLEEFSGIFKDLELTRVNRSHIPALFGSVDKNQDDYLGTIL
jgi:hypothetical protein